MMINNKKIYIALCALCIVIIGVLYVTERQKQPVLTPIYVAGEKDSAENPNEDGPAIEQTKIKVYITGEVVNPGVYEMNIDDRVDDLLKKAGGHTEQADMLAVNLAAYINDAEKIIIPTKGETVDKSGAEAQNSIEVDDLIDINSADSKTLTTLPGIGDVIAGNIIKYREENGGFNSVDEIQKVPRIGKVTYENMKDLITIR